MGAAGPLPKDPVQAAPLGQQPMLPASSSSQLVFFGQQAALFIEEQELAHFESRRNRSMCMRPREGEIGENSGSRKGEYWTARAVGSDRRMDRA